MTFTDRWDDPDIRAAWQDGWNHANEAWEERQPPSPLVVVNRHEIEAMRELVYRWAREDFRGNEPSHRAEARKLLETIGKDDDGS
jgi:hypothetical protein